MLGAVLGLVVLPVVRADEIKNELHFVFAERVEDVWKETLIPLYIAKGHDRKYDEAEYRAERQQKEKADRAEQR